MKLHEILIKDNLNKKFSDASGAIYEVRFVSIVKHNISLFSVTTGQDIQDIHSLYSLINEEFKEVMRSVEVDESKLELMIKQMVEDGYCAVGAELCNTCELDLSCKDCIKNALLINNNGGK